MKYVKTLEEYNYDLISEKLNLQPLFDKLKTSINKKMVFTLIIASLLTVFNQAQAVEYIKNNSKISSNDKKELINAVPKYMDPTKMYLSQKGWDFIRDNEKYISKAKNIGDGMITIGYGHAEPISTSKYKIDDVISKKDAYRLYLEDVNVAAAGVKRMFKEWKDDGINVKITQNQYDVLVDMVYNMGINNFRQTKFVQALKEYDLQKAANLIRKTGLKDNFSGLEKRRKKEFIKFIIID